MFRLRRWLDASVKLLVFTAPAAGLGLRRRKGPELLQRTVKLAPGPVDKPIVPEKLVAGSPRPAREAKTDSLPRELPFQHAQDGAELRCRQAERSCQCAGTVVADEEMEARLPSKRESVAVPRRFA